MKGSGGDVTVSKVLIVFVLIQSRRSSVTFEVYM
jgi:hypothetical protein